MSSAEKLALATKLGAAGGAIRHDGPWLETVRARGCRGCWAPISALSQARTRRALEPGTHSSLDRYPRHDPRHDLGPVAQVRALAPNGVDLILDCVAGSYAEQNLEVRSACAAPSSPSPTLVAPLRTLL